MCRAPNVYMFVYILIIAPIVPLMTTWNTAKATATRKVRLPKQGLTQYM